MGPIGPTQSMQICTWIHRVSSKRLYPGTNIPLRPKKRFRARNNLKPSCTQSKSKARENNSNCNIYMVVPYTKGLSKGVKNIFGKVGIQIHFRGGNTIKALQIALKDKDNIAQKSAVIYRDKCDRLDCVEEYI